MCSSDLSHELWQRIRSSAFDPPGRGPTCGRLRWKGWGEDTPHLCHAPFSALGGGVSLFCVSSYAFVALGGVSQLPSSFVLHAE